MAMLELFVGHLDFDICRYATLNPERGSETGTGEVLFEIRREDAPLGVQSYSHTGWRENARF